MHWASEAQLGWCSRYKFFLKSVARLNYTKPSVSLCHVGRHFS